MHATMEHMKKKEVKFLLLQLLFCYFYCLCWDLFCYCHLKKE